MSNFFYIPRVGDVIFFRTKFELLKPMTWLSTIIRPIATIKYNHVENIVYFDGIYYCIGAIKEGYKKRPYHEVIKCKEILIKRPKVSFDKIAYNLRLRMIEGSKYDKKGLLYDQFILNVLNRWKGAKTENEAKKRFYCYEAFWYSYKEFFGKEWYKQKPKNTINAEFLETVFEGTYKIN